MPSGAAGGGSTAGALESQCRETLSKFRLNAAEQTMVLQRSFGPALDKLRSEDWQSLVENTAELQRLGFSVADIRSIVMNTPSVATAGSPVQEWLQFLTTYGERLVLLALAVFVLIISAL